MKRIVGSLFALSLFATTALAQTPPVPLGPGGAAATSGGTTYTAAANGGLALTGSAFSLGDGAGISYAFTSSSGQLSLLGAASSISVANAGTCLSSASVPSVIVGNATTGLASVSTTGFCVDVNGVDKLDYGKTTAGAWTITGAQLIGTQNISGFAANELNIPQLNFNLITQGIASNINIEYDSLQNIFVFNSAAVVGWSSSALNSVSATTLRSNKDTGTSRIGPAIVGIGNGTSGSVVGYLKYAASEAGIVYSVAGTAVPSASTLGIGARVFVSDATACALGTTYTGSGSTACPLYSDGTNWKEGG